MDMRGETDRNTVIAGYINTPLTPVDGSSGQKINQDTAALHDTPHQVDLTDVSERFTFFSSARGTLSTRDTTLGHKTSLGTFKAETTPSTFSDHIGMN